MGPALNVEGDDGPTLPRSRGAGRSRRLAQSLDADLVDDGVSTRVPDDADGDGAHGRSATRPPDAADPVEPPLVLTVAQLEAALQLGRTRTYELIRSGEIPVLRVGRLIRISRAALERWIAECSLSTASESSHRFGHLP